VRSHAATADYWALTKPEIDFLIAIVTFAGFYPGLPAKVHGFPFLLLMRTLGYAAHIKWREYSEPIYRAAL